MGLFATRKDRSRVNRIVHQTTDWYRRMGYTVDLSRVAIHVTAWPRLFGIMRASYQRISQGGMLLFSCRTGRGDERYDHIDIAHELAHRLVHQHQPEMSREDDEFVAVTMQVKRLHDLGFTVDCSTENPLHQQALDRLESLGLNAACDEVRRLIGGDEANP